MQLFQTTVLNGSYDLKLVLLSDFGELFVLYHLMFYSPITDLVWKGTVSLAHWVTRLSERVKRVLPP